MLFEAVALFLGKRGRDGGMGVERGEQVTWCIWKHHPGMSLMGTFLPPPLPAPIPAHPPLEKP